ncbi:MAG: DNA-3-methyladenine glycosylase I [Lachnospiraceae bacterium]
MNRCKWVNLKNPVYIKYHDEEWSVPTHDEHELYELFILESFQAGLSWECVLNKREFFRKAYDGFDVDKVAAYDETKYQELLSNPKIIRNKLKIKASIKNSIIFKQIQKEFGSFDAYIWGFTGGKTIREAYTERTTSVLSDEISKDLKKRGMTFVGSTIIYSYLQAVGILAAHGSECEWCMKKY